MQRHASARKMSRFELEKIVGYAAKRDSLARCFPLSERINQVC